VARLAVMEAYSDQDSQEAVIRRWDRD
jgi:hypothetical protein